MATAGQLNHGFPPRNICITINENLMMIVLMWKVLTISRMRLAREFMLF